MKLHTFLLSILIFCSFSFGDGMNFWGNRLSGYTTSTITLTESQINSLQNIDSLRVINIELTDSQKDFINQNSRYEMDSLEVYSLRFAKNTCTCEAFDFGILFSANRVEIPHRYLGYKEFVKAWENGNRDYVFFEDPFLANKFYDYSISRYQKIVLSTFTILLIVVLVLKRKKITSTKVSSSRIE